MELKYYFFSIKKIKKNLRVPWRALTFLGPQFGVPLFPMAKHLASDTSWEDQSPAGFAFGPCCASKPLLASQELGWWYPVPFPDGEAFPSVSVTGLGSPVHSNCGACPSQEWGAEEVGGLGKESLGFVQGLWD